MAIRLFFSLFNTVFDTVDSKLKSLNCPFILNGRTTLRYTKRSGKSQCQNATANGSQGQKLRAFFHPFAVLQSSGFKIAAKKFICLFSHLFTKMIPVLEISRVTDSAPKNVLLVNGVIRLAIFRRFG